MAHLDKKLVWQRADGGVSITHLDSADKLEGETDDEFVARYTDRLKPVFGVDPIVVDKNDLPKNRDNRNEWSLNGKKIEVDQTKVDAKEAKEAEKQAVLDKIGITAEELGKIK